MKKTTREKIFEIMSEELQSDELTDLVIALTDIMPEHLQFFPLNKEEINNLFVDNAYNAIECVINGDFHLEDDYFTYDYYNDKIVSYNYYYIYDYIFPYLFDDIIDVVINNIDAIFKNYGLNDDLIYVLKKVNEVVKNG